MNYQCSEMPPRPIKVMGGIVIVVTRANYSLNMSFANSCVCLYNTLSVKKYAAIWALELKYSVSKSSFTCSFV